MEDQRAEEIWYENEWRSGRDPNRYGRCPMDVLNIPQYPVPPFGCAFYLDVEYRKDCYFFSEEHYIGATIPSCSYFREFGKCPCKDCAKYISKLEVYRMIVDKVNSLDAGDV